jgi:prophage antirepressor-like protein
MQNANAIQTFRFEEHEVRVVGTPEAPLFVAADVGECLGIAKVRNTLDAFPDDEKGAHTVGTPGGAQQMLCLTEPGLYRLIFISRQERAETFRRWVLHDVLPAIRRTGHYGAGPDLTGLAAVLTAALAPITARFERLETALTARNEPTTFVPPWVGRDIRQHITALAKARTKGDPARYRRERGCVELELRVRFSFGPGAGKAWRAFPAALWPEMRARLDEMERETARALTGTQLTLC